MESSLNQKLHRSSIIRQGWYEPLLDSWTLDAAAACTTPAHHLTDDCVGQQRFRLKNHSHRSERNPKV